MNKIQKNKGNIHQEYGYSIPMYSMMRTKIYNSLGGMNININDGNSLKYTNWFRQKEIILFIFAEIQKSIMKKKQIHNSIMSNKPGFLHFNQSIGYDISKILTIMKS